MIRPLVVLLAETVLHDRQTNSMSVINLLEELNTAGFPILIPRLSILAVLGRDSDEDTPIRCPRTDPH